MKITTLDLAGNVDPSLPDGCFPNVTGVEMSQSAMAFSPARTTVVVPDNGIAKLYRVWH